MAVVRDLVQTLPDGQIARVLNRLGYRTGASNTWTQARVMSLRASHQIPAFAPSSGESRLLTITDAARILGVKHCVAMCNGTIALEIATRALELRGEVIVPSFTFIATAHALQWQGITPVFADIDPATHNLDAVAVERRWRLHSAAAVTVDGPSSRRVWNAT